MNVTSRVGDDSRTSTYCKCVVVLLKPSEDEYMHFCSGWKALKSCVINECGTDWDSAASNVPEENKHVFRNMCGEGENVEVQERICLLLADILGGALIARVAPIALLFSLVAQFML